MRRVLFVAEHLNISHSEKSSARYYHKCTYIFMQSTSHFCQILMKLEFPQQIKKKKSNMRREEKPTRCH